MDPQSIGEFLRRDWRSVSASKQAYWAERYQREGWRPVWDASQALLAYVRQIGTGFPTQQDRDADFADHLHLRSRLDRAAHAFARR